MRLFSQFTAELEPIWERVLSLEPTRWPFFTFAWHRTWQKHLGNDEQLAIMYDPDASVIIPLALQNGTAHFTGGEEIADYLDAIGSEEKKAAAWQSALPLLKQHGAARLLLRNIPSASPTIEYFRNLSGADITQEDTTPILTL